jgi:hypothetical protein
MKIHCYDMQDHRRAIAVAENFFGHNEMIKGDFYAVRVAAESRLGRVKQAEASAQGFGEILESLRERRRGPAAGCRAEQTG